MREVQNLTAPLDGIKRIARHDSGDSTLDTQVVPYSSAPCRGVAGRSVLKGCEYRRLREAAFSIVCSHASIDDVIRTCRESRRSLYVPLPVPDATATATAVTK